jgi:hypothetical protein
MFSDAGQHTPRRARYIWPLKPRTNAETIAFGQHVNLGKVSSQIKVAERKVYGTHSSIVDCIE